MAFTSGRFVLSHALLFLLFFPVLFSIVIIAFGEEGAGKYVSRVLVSLFCTRQFLSFLSSAWRQGLAAACECGIP